VNVSLSIFKVNFINKSWLSTLIFGNFKAENCLNLGNEGIPSPLPRYTCIILKIFSETRPEDGGATGAATFASS